jgi:hypothetical protein
MFGRCKRCVPAVAARRLGIVSIWVDHVGDDPAHVAANRTMLRQRLPAEPLWLQQVHGNAAVDAEIAQICRRQMLQLHRQPGRFAP